MRGVFEKMKFNGEWTKKKWVPYTIATCSAVVLFMVLAHLKDITTGISSFFGFIKPVTMSIIIAYVFNPFANLFDKKVLKSIKNEKRRWTLSVICALIVLVLAIVLLFVALIPQLIESISTLINNMDDYIATLQNLLLGLESSGATKLFGLDLTSLANVTNKILDLISEYFSNNMGSVANTTANLGKGVLDLALAIILAIYFLLDKRNLVSATGRFMSLCMSEESYEKTTSFLTRCNDIIIKYIGVDVIDGLIVGCVNFLFMIIFGMPYSVLISVIVGITNLAPTFGPLAGAIIGAFILVLIKPWQALAFLIFTIVIQTIDGYILKPKLFGGSLGVSALMILISIILGGRLFGVIGILLAIPFAAILDFTWRDFVVKKLEEKRAKRYNNQ